MQHFDLYKLPKSKLTNAHILWLVRFGYGPNKLVQLLIRSWNSGSWTIRSLALSHGLCSCGCVCVWAGLNPGIDNICASIVPWFVQLWLCVCVCDRTEPSNWRRDSCRHCPAFCTVVTEWCQLHTTGQTLKLDLLNHSLSCVTLWSYGQGRKAGWMWSRCQSLTWANWVYLIPASNSGARFSKNLRKNPKFSISFS